MYRSISENQKVNGEWSVVSVGAGLDGARFVHNRCGPFHFSSGMPTMQLFECRVSMHSVMEMPCPVRWILRPRLRDLPDGWDDIPFSNVSKDFRTQSDFSLCNSVLLRVLCDPGSRIQRHGVRMSNVEQGMSNFEFWAPDPGEFAKFKKPTQVEYEIIHSIPHQSKRRPQDAGRGIRRHVRIIRDDNCPR